MRLYINSGKHASRKIDQRISEIEKNVSSPDVVFTEDSVRKPTLREYGSTFALAPLLVGTMILWGKVVLPAVQLAFEKDKKIEQHLEMEYGADIVPTDAPALELIQDESKLWSMSNWISLGLIGLIVLETGVLNEYLFVFTLLFGFGSSLFLAFLAGNQYARNSHIAERIQSHSEKYDEAVLVTGGEHQQGITELLHSSDAVFVENSSQSSQQ
ncbi:hypothetical protein [Halorubrum sp. SP9]|uniref:hypothetical protein n=1 Tax=Halorubrum sp. SP9 TaxID=1537267 RepID=UPI0010F6C05F|nr:hypothetical protein [Halorubrum sp. SP9]TKX70792.1 hypothetical protein EXE45_03155 [Halorubrum sp. SP9]